MLRGRRQGLPLPDQGSLLLEVGASLALPSAAIIGLPVLRGPCLWSTFFLALFFLERFLHHRTVNTDSVCTCLQLGMETMCIKYYLIWKYGMYD